MAWLWGEQHMLDTWAFSGQASQPFCGTCPAMICLLLLPLPSALCFLWMTVLVSLITQRGNWAHQYWSL